MQKGFWLLVTNLAIALIVLFNQATYLISSVTQISTVRSVFTNLGGELNIFKMYLELGLQVLFIFGLITLIWFCVLRLKSKKVLSKKEKPVLKVTLIFQILLFFGILSYNVYSFIVPLYNLNSLF